MSGLLGRTPRNTRLDSPNVLSVAPNVDPPPADSFAWKLWLQAGDIANTAIETAYIGGIGNGSLDPNDYGHYTIQDVAYCSSAITDYESIITRAQQAGFNDIATFATARKDGYVTYAGQLEQAWHIGDATGVSPGPAAAQYIALEKLVADRFPPIYGIIVMLPCYQLWAWLANKLEPYSPSGNLYQFWIEENLGWDSAYRIDNFLNTWDAAHLGTIDPVLAAAVFNAAM